MNKQQNEIVIYKTKQGSVSLISDNNKETLLANINQIADLFGVQKPAISKHLKNIFKDGELTKKATVSILETVQKEGSRSVKRNIEYYNLDAIISVGYRINSKSATDFRIWATQTLKEHITQGFTINKDRLAQDKTKFLEAVDTVKLLTKDRVDMPMDDVLELIVSFSHTWFSLENYDKSNFPVFHKQDDIKLDSNELYDGIAKLKQTLIDKGEATALFAQEKNKGSLDSVFCSVFQSVFGNDAYPSIEEKAAHLLYFIIKNHPFSDGNKRSGAFSFIWFLHKAGFDYSNQINPATLTSLSLLIAESHPDEKDKVIGLVLLLLNKK